MGITHFDEISAPNTIKWLSGSLSAVDTAGGLFAVKNPEGVDIIIDEIIVDVTTQATGVCTADFGVAANATTSSDTLMDGVDVGSAVIIADGVANAGINGVNIQKATSSQYITGSVATGASAGIVGKYYIRYRKA